MKSCKRDDVMVWCQGASPRCSSRAQPRKERKEGTQGERKKKRERVLTKKQNKTGLMGSAQKNKNASDTDIRNLCQGYPWRNKDCELQMGLYIGSDKSAGRLPDKWSILIKSIWI